MIKIDLKKYFPQIIIAVITLIILVISIILFNIGNDKHRRMFIFPSADAGKYIVEYRNLAKNPVQGDIQLYVDEILLGSATERTKMLFTPGTVVRSCFLRDSVLYLNLSQTLIDMGEGVIEIKDGFELLEKNIKKNFPKIKKVEFFIEGKSVFEK
ncbi:MAG: GerMN domain-containing protein [Treponema sp.]|nr:GerMN domain-containing protein [Treponema sp.]